MACAIPLGRIFSLPPSGSFIIWLILPPSSGLSSVSPNNPTTSLYVFQKHPHCHLSSSWGYELLQGVGIFHWIPRIQILLPRNVCWKEVNMCSSLLEIRWVNASETGLTHHIFHRLRDAGLTNSTTLSLLLSPPNSSTYIKSFPLLPLTFPFSN